MALVDGDEFGAEAETDDGDAGFLDGVGHAGNGDELFPFEKVVFGRHAFLNGLAGFYAVPALTAKACWCERCGTFYSSGLSRRIDLW